MDEFKTSEYHVKKGRLGFSLVNEYGEKLSRDVRKKAGIKFYNKSDEPYSHPTFTFTQNGVESEKCRLISQYSENQAMIFTEDQHGFFNINFNTGIISPEFIGYTDKLYLSNDGTIYQMDENGNSVDTGYKTALNTLKGYRFKADLNGYLEVIDKDGNYGRIDNDLNVKCPFIFKNDSFSCKIIDEENKLLRVYDNKNKILYIFDKDFNEIYRNTFKEMTDFEKICENCYSFYDKKTNESTIFEYNSETNTLEQIGHFNCNVKYACRVGNEVYVNINSSTLRKLSDNSKVLENCSEIAFREIDGEPVVVFRAPNYHHSIDTLGIYSLKEEKIILSPSEMVHRVSLSDSAKMPDGSYRFLCQATMSRGNYSPTSNKWGVLNDKGETLVDFEYYYDPNKRQTFTRKDKNGDVKEILLTNGYAKKYFNIREDNIIATTQEEKRIRLPKEKPERRYNWDDCKPTLKQKYSEGEKIGAAVLASLVFDSPIAGMFVYGAMDEAEIER